jgi:23S rRNA (cytosine1962-C5)-methyltransferase
MAIPQLPALDAAWQRRVLLHPSTQTTAYRLINRSGDGFPNLAVDRYGEVLVAHVYSQGVKVQPPRTVLQALADRVGAQAVYIKYRPVQGNVLKEETRRALTPSEPLIGRAIERVEVIEHGSRFIIHPGEGLNPGLFLDMREVREFVRANAASKTVLNCFATPAPLAWLRCEAARRVLNLDVSRHYLDWGRENAG